MRYDQILSFIKTFQGEYDEVTGDYTDQDEESLEIIANVCDMAEEVQLRLLGELKRGALTAYTKAQAPSSFDYILHKGRSYDLVSSRQLRGKHTYHLRERL